MKPTICPYCGSPVNFRDSKMIYGISYGMVYICSQYPKCDAFVGVHKHNKEALGRLANHELREWKKKAHRYFDPIWEYRKKRTNDLNSLSKAYLWLANRLDINVESCHIGMFDVDKCVKVVAICKSVYEQYPKIRDYAKAY